jgi:DNA repair exonuclease SbcCD ATPase subunit
MKQMQKLAEEMQKSKQEETGKDLENLNKQMQKKSLEQKMNKSSNSMQKGDKDNSMEQQDELSQDLNDFNQKMQDMLSQMMENENNKLMSKMQELANQLQEESDKQAKLQEQSKNLNPDSPGEDFKENAKDQNELSQQLSKSIDQLMSLSKDIPSLAPMLGKDLGDAYNKMQDAEKQLEGKNGKKANSSQGDAKNSLDKAISKLQSMCKKGNMPGKGSSLQMLLQALQQMIGRQQALNQQMGELGQKGNEGKLSQEDMAQMQRLQGEQQAIQKGMQQLNKEFKEQQEKEGTKMLGNLDEIQKQMEEVIKDMQNGNITPETRKRQEKILSRMLDFQLSQREKDFEKKRESKPGKNFDRTSPPEIVISRPNIIDGVNQDALDLQKESYSEDYEALIQKYMQKMRNGEK